MAIGTAPAHAATGVDEWRAWDIAHRQTWLKDYVSALFAASQGNTAPMRELVKRLMQMLGVSYSEALAILQNAVVHGDNMIFNVLIIGGHTDERRDAAWGDVDGYETASMRINFPDSGNGRDGEGTVETDCIGGTDEFGNDADCDEESWGMTAWTETVHADPLGPICIAHLSGDISVAVAGECDEHAGQTVPVDYLIVYGD